MASAPDGKHLGLGVAATLLTATLLWFGTGLHPYWPLMWFAPLPVLLFANRASGRGTFCTAAVACALGNTNLWNYLHRDLGTPVASVLRIYALLGVVFALAVLLYRALLRRGAYWAALLAFPAFWVSFEYLLNLTSPHGTGGNFAYSQLNFLPFLQLASLTGPWGMSFVLLLTPAAVALAVHLRRSAPKQALHIAAVSFAVLAAVLLFGAARLAVPVSGESVKVGLVASDGPNEHVADEGPATDALLRAYADAVQILASAGAEVVVLPEKVGVTVDPTTESVDAQLQSLANQAHVRLVVGLVHVVPPAAGKAMKLKYNEARVYTPGAGVESYDKEHMLPPFESELTPGTSLRLLSSTNGAGTWGVQICKDMDFTQLSRRYGNSGAGLMLVPGWDFFSDWIQHGHIAIMRGVESGFSVVRSAKGGSMFVSDDRGRILAETRSDSAPFATLLVTVPSRHERTLYLRWGDWVAWLALGLLACTLGLLRFTPNALVSGVKSAAP
ncbi:MAG TPA: nitrilase-related carbon-nitrogen hydrolase [Steroidobacteraceae bacterium]|jgi:apolipoprotein N-acyltransferase|nr:nitrilase-related carbon-nitrogen hydrolase [Steroidobacteraceae bacterium]